MTTKYTAANRLARFIDYRIDRFIHGEEYAKYGTIRNSRGRYTPKAVQSHSKSVCAVTEAHRVRYQPIKVTGMNGEFYI